MMGINPSELKDLTPYEFNLMREGFRSRQEDEWIRTRLQAWVTYASSTTGDIKPIEEWHPLPSDEIRKAERDKLKDGREISAELKAELEAQMNKRS